MIGRLLAAAAFGCALYAVLVYGDVPAGREWTTLGGVLLLMERTR